MTTRFFKVFQWVDFNIFIFPVVLCILLYALIKVLFWQDIHWLHQIIKGIHTTPKMLRSPEEDQYELAARWLTVEKAMMAPVVHTAEALSGHMAVGENWTKFPRVGYGSKLASQGPLDTKSLW